MNKTPFTHYRQGLKNLIDALGTDHPRVTAVRILQQHLIENLNEPAAREDILNRLNLLCLELTGKPFQKFCDMAQPTPPPKKPSATETSSKAQKPPVTYEDYVNWLQPLIEQRRLALPATRKSVQAHTIAVLQNMGPAHKGKLIQYLYSSGLIAANSTVISLAQANLSNAVLVEANMAGSDFSEADLSGANLVGSTLLQANLHGAKLAGANMSWAILSGADLSNTELGGAILTCADMRAANLEGANLVKANLKQVDVTGGSLSGVNMLGSNFEGAVLTVADLSETQLLWTNFTGARLDGANLENAKYNQHTQWPAGFNPATQGAIKID